MTGSLDEGAGRRVAYGLLLGLLCYVAWLLGAEAAMAERAVLLRYGSLLAAGVLAMAGSHVLFPDAQTPLYQLLNRAPAKLLAAQGRAWSTVVLLFMLPMAVLAFYDPGQWGLRLTAKAVRWMEHGLIVAGVGAYSLVQYATIGARSQAWQEGRAGQWYARMVETGGQGFSIPRGLVPALFVTAQVFIVALGAIIGAAYLERLGMLGASWLPGGTLLALAGGRLLRLRSAFDRHFYHTNAFYSEVMGGGGAQVQARAPVAYNALYWVPHRWRPAAWAGLRQMDRVLPLGRLVALGHLVLWVLFLQGAEATVIAGYLVLFITAQNAACFLLRRPALAPPAFHLMLRAPVSWGMVRFFINLRWMLPFVLSLGLVALVGDALTWRAVLGWSLLNGSMAAGSAALVTALHEGTLRRRYA